MDEFTSHITEEMLRWDNTIDRIDGLIEYLRDYFGVE